MWVHRGVILLFLSSDLETWKPATGCSGGDTQKKNTQSILSPQAEQAIMHSVNLDFSNLTLGQAPCWHWGAEAEPDRQVPSPRKLCWGTVG